MQRIHHVFEVAAPPDAVREAVTTGAGLSAWWTTRVEADPRVGGLIHFTFAGDFNPTMRISELASDRVGWVYDGGHEPWEGSTFTFELEPRGTGTVVGFTQGYGRELSDEAFGSYNYNWGYYLESLRLLCETGTGRPFQAGGEHANSAGTAQWVSIARATAKPELAGKLADELLARVAPTRAQPGNVEFTLHRSVDDPAVIVALERWESRADWERHLQGPHVTTLMAVFEEVLAGPPEIQLYVPLAGHHDDAP